MNVTFIRGDDLRSRLSLALAFPMSGGNEPVKYWTTQEMNQQELDVENVAKELEKTEGVVTTEVALVCIARGLDRCELDYIRETSPSQVLNHVAHFG